MDILVDMDSTLVDLAQSWIDVLNAQYGTRVTKSDIKVWDFAAAFPGIEKRLVYAPLHKSGLFLNARPMPGGLRALRSLQEAGHRVFILSSPSGPQSAKEKLEWLQRHAPFIDSKDIFLGNKKTMVRGDVLIDDHPETLVDYRRTWPSAMCTTISWPYNEHLAQLRDPLLFVSPDYREPLRAWANIYTHVVAFGRQRDQQGQDLIEGGATT